MPERVRTSPGMKSLTDQPWRNQALHFLIAIKETLGDAWLNNSRYRFGASALPNDLLRQIETERTGAYQAPYVFSDATEGY